MYCFHNTLVCNNARKFAVRIKIARYRIQCKKQWDSEAVHVNLRKTSRNLQRCEKCVSKFRMKRFYILKQLNATKLVLDFTSSIRFIY